MSMYMWKEIWMIAIAVTVLESSITSEPVTYLSNTGRCDYQNMHIAMYKYSSVKNTFKAT